MNFPIVEVGISLSPKPSKFLTILEINFSIVSESIGLFLVAILIDFEILLNNALENFWNHLLLF